MSLPGPDVLAAFELAGSPLRLPGGEGRSVRVGNVVLKPAGPDIELAEWLAGTMAAVSEDGFRLARPLRARTGAWSYGGWTASRFVPGTDPDHTAAPRWLDILTAGRAFHHALAHVPRPGLLDHRNDRWATADLVAWQEQEADLHPALRKAYRELTALLGPTPRARAQLIHGDLTGNVLFAPGQAPAVIDFSPYWRPPVYAEAIVVADALIWHGASAELLHQAAPANGPGFTQYVVRAVIFRLVTTSEHLRSLPTGNSQGTASEARRYEHAVRTLTGIAPAQHP
ncbi:aminoglycoside phosphotransferase [Streptomyces sp. NPDC002886]|uniref:aminoglycoside phosphotransferase n=1 Tax=Streptomyces sp. NPDC002886 TaxID=3364667 RepID=UPI00368B676D